MPQAGEQRLDAIGVKWAALHEVANVVAAIAGVKAGAPAPGVETFEAVMRDADTLRRRLAEQGIEDLIAILEPGVAALLSAITKGSEPREVARALWREFAAARDALLSIASTDGDGPVHLV